MRCENWACLFSFLLLAGFSFPGFGLCFSEKPRGSSLGVGGGVGLFSPPPSLAPHGQGSLKESHFARLCVKTKGTILVYFSGDWHNLGCLSGVRDFDPWPPFETIGSERFLFGGFPSRVVL